LSPRSGRTGQRTRQDDEDRSVLIIVENQSYFTDTRVKAEARSLRDAGWRVHVVCPGQPEGRGGRANEEILVDGVSVHPYRVKFAARGIIGYAQEYLGSLFHTTRLALRLRRSRGLSVVHLCNPPDILFIPGLLLKWRGVKVIFDHHDLFPEMILSRHKGLLRWVLYRFARLLEYLTFRAADAVLSTNESYKSIAVGRGRLDARDVFVVRNGPPAGEFAPLPPMPSLKKGFPLMACYAGIMGPEDGVLELMDVIREVVLGRGRTDVLFCLLGDGAAKTEAERRARAWGLGACLDMPGMIHDRDLFRRYLSTADVMLAPEISNPHNDKSTFIKIAEYMAMGKPIVSYDLKETRFTAGEAAVFVASGDARAYAEAVIGLLDDPERRRRMGEIGIERIRDVFQWKHQERRLLEAYDHVFRRSNDKG
jgi:glycosyltransferase involved in cell wall biosynthesis